MNKPLKYTLIGIAAVFGIGLISAGLNSLAGEPTGQPEPTGLPCTNEHAYERVIQGIQEKFQGPKRVSSYSYSADAVSTQNPDYTFWVKTEVVVDGRVRYQVEGGLQCLDDRLALGWLDLQPVQ
jgi:hypothetical protein